MQSFALRYGVFEAPKKICFPAVQPQQHATIVLNDKNTLPGGMILAKFFSMKICFHSATKDSQRPHQKVEAFTGRLNLKGFKNIRAPE
jgi:hypothetical protein